MDVTEYIEKFRHELDSVMKFWTTHSHDLHHGGFFSCLSESGEVFDTTKYGWMQARQVWMYSKLYNTVLSYHTTSILQSAIAGGDFLMNFQQVSGNTRCYFATTEDGKPCKLQRKPYTECFYVMALAELYRATGNKTYQIASETMLSQVIHWIRVDDSSLGVVKLSGLPSSQELGHPMMLLNVLTEFCGTDEEMRKKYSEDFDWAVAAILKHSDGIVVREFVRPDGTTLPGFHGRQLTPGHALEAGWILLQEARIRGDDNLRQIAIEQFIDHPHSYGSDLQHGGFFYFLDSSGHSPVQLEWSMKLWWVHCEAMLAFIMAYQATRDKRHWTNFAQLCQLCFNKFSDPEHGEWYGYLTRDWKVNQSFKGGPYKGCYHVPRALLYCLQILEQIQEHNIDC